VISQRLLPAIAGGRVAAYEVMVANEAIRNLVREGKSRQMRNMIATGAGEGMQTVEMDLARLVAAGLLSLDVAMGASAYPKEVQAQLATARAQIHAHATMATGQAGSSGSGTYAGQPMAPPPVPATNGN
jgi:twitching motility protein PilT